MDEPPPGLKPDMETSSGLTRQPSQKYCPPLCREESREAFPPGAHATSGRRHMAEPTMPERGPQGRPARLSWSEPHVRRCVASTSVSARGEPRGRAPSSARDSHVRSSL